MPSFFIDRPIFAWVVALLICLGGLLAIPQLPIAQYPIIAPPSISISTSYPGASPENIYNSVTRLIEEELNGAAGILNFESTSDSLGQIEIIANFVPGTNTESASVEVQNRLKRVEARLPRAVMQQGILVEEASSAVLQIITLRSTDGTLDEVALGDFMMRNIEGELRRIPGVGRVTLYSTERSLRVWIDPDQAGRLQPHRRRRDQGDQRAECAGRLGRDRRGAGPRRPADFRAGAGEGPAPVAGGIRRHRAARQHRRLDRAAARRRAHRDRRPQLSVQHPAERRGDRGPFRAAGADRQRARDRDRGQGQDGGVVELLPGQHQVRHSLRHHAGGRGLDPEGADHACCEAVVLVFLVMLLFLQNIRYTIIPTIVVPVALLGTCAVLLLMGLSINMLTLFAMVLAIGILVDDAIVVVENVERIMSEEGLSPKEATRKAMGQITGAIIGITLVLISVFIPMAFFPGSVGIIYKQFSVTMVAAIGFSALMALSLTPALCATMLKPVEAGHHHAKRGLFGWFNRRMDAARDGYRGLVERLPAADRPDHADLCRDPDRGRLGAVPPARRLPAGRRSGLHHGGRAGAAGGFLQPHARRRSRRPRNIC